MSAQDLAQFVEQYHRSVDAFVQGDPEPSKRLYSRGDDATLANPISPPMRGWNQIEGAIDRAAAQLREGERCTWEHISGYATADLAYSLDIQRTRMKVGDGGELAPVALRV